MLSRPRKPPAKRWSPSGSIRLTHQVKFISSLGSRRARKSWSRRPSMSHTCSAAQACTGGLTSPKAHSYAGSAPLGFWNHSRHSASSWYLAKAGSRCARATVWKARSQAANHGYSQGSGIDRMSRASRLSQPALRPVAAFRRWRRLRRVAVQPALHVVAVELLAPDHPGERLAGHQARVVVDVGRDHLGVELVGLACRAARAPRRSAVPNAGRRRRRPQPDPDDLGLARRDGEPVPGRALGAGCRPG